MKRIYFQKLLRDDKIERAISLGVQETKWNDFLKAMPKKQKAFPSSQRKKQVTEAPDTVSRDSRVAEIRDSSASQFGCPKRQGGGPTAMASGNQERKAEEWCKQPEQRDSRDKGSCWTLQTDGHVTGSFLRDMNYRRVGVQPLGQWELQMWQIQGQSVKVNFPGDMSQQNVGDIKILLHGEDPLEKGKSTHFSILGLPLWLSW